MAKPKANHTEEKKPKRYESHNMNYVFYVEYFEHLEQWLDGDSEADMYSKGIENFIFNEDSPMKAWKQLDGYGSFALKTCYPGLLIGTGNPHNLNMDSVIKCGFSFDSVTGLPYIPGSSLKGMLRSYFPGEKDRESAKEYEAYIGSIIESIQMKNHRNTKMDVKALEIELFEKKDIFLGAYPCDHKGKALLEVEYITPHNKGIFKNPQPINLVKVRPEISFEFGFCLYDYEEKGAVFSAADKLELFKQLILDMGIGAKTNVGFGKFQEQV